MIEEVDENNIEVETGAMRMTEMKGHRDSEMSSFSHFPLTVNLMVSIHFVEAEARIGLEESDRVNTKIILGPVWRATKMRRGK